MRALSVAGPRRGDSIDLDIQLLRGHYMRTLFRRVVYPCPFPHRRSARRTVQWGIKSPKVEICRNVLRRRIY